MNFFENVVCKFFFIRFIFPSLFDSFELSLLQPATEGLFILEFYLTCLLYTSPSPRDRG